MKAINYFNEKEKSKYREKLIEHAFSKDLLISAANKCKDVFIARSQSDMLGNVTMIQNKQPRKIRVIKLKVYNESARIWSVHRQLLSSASGQVILVKIEEKDGSLDFQYFMFDKKQLKETLSQPVQKTNPENCRTKRSDYIKVPVNKLYDKLFA